MRPCPPSFSLANTKTVSPSAIRFPPYIVFWEANENMPARGSIISALIAYCISIESWEVWDQCRSELSPCSRRVREFLARDCRGIHETALGHGENRHTVVITPTRVRVGRIATRFRADAAGPGARFCADRDGYGAGVRAKSK